jgi:hypothetical protein
VDIISSRRVKPFWNNCLFGLFTLKLVIHLAIKPFNNNNLLNSCELNKSIIS